MHMSFHFLFGIPLGVVQQLNMPNIDFNRIVGVRILLFPWTQITCRKETFSNVVFPNSLEIISDSDSTIILLISGIRAL